MKHNLNITLVLLGVFILAQIVGLVIIKEYINIPQSLESGELSYEQLPFNIERPEVEENVSYIYIITAMLLGTGILLILIYFKTVNLWKIWFTIAVIATLSIALKPFLTEKIAIVAAVILAMFKVYKPNLYVHNITELFIYGGLAAILVPILNIKSAIILLIAISIYDAYAVWKSKHMIKMAKFQTEANLFAGFFIPYKKPKSNKGKLVKVKSAVLGGGDIGFPLIFSGVVLQNLIFTNTLEIAFLKTLIITLTTSIALGLLLTYSKKDKFYPAMPFISAGCFVGYLIILLI